MCRLPLPHPTGSPILSPLTSGDWLSSAVFSHPCESTGASRVFLISRILASYSLQLRGCQVEPCVCAVDVSFLRFLAATSSVFLSSLDESSCRFSYSILMCLLGSFWFVDKAAIASLAAERVCLPFEVKYGEALILEIRENKLIICLNRQSPLHLPLPVLL